MARVCDRLGVEEQDVTELAVVRRAHDARKRTAIEMVYSVDVAVREEEAVLRRAHTDPRIARTPSTQYRPPVQAPADCSRPIVIGAGPCGLFAGLLLAQMGFRPIILDRGKVVRERTQDTWALWRRGILDPESNVQFGEGGAGTFSDGKLYSQIKDPRHLGRKVLTEFVEAGAPPEILTEAKPHIGTFRLVAMVERLRRTIETLGGEYRFQSRVVGLEPSKSESGRLALTLRNGERIMLSWPLATAPATLSRCCFKTVSPWRPSPSPSACASNTPSR
jgi:uncharacterized FAD-dependent dehydrogenase